MADADEDDGQFEPEEDDTDKARRMASESPLNKIVPIPDGTSFFVFANVFNCVVRLNLVIFSIDFYYFFLIVRIIGCFMCATSFDNFFLKKY